MPWWPRRFCCDEDLALIGYDGRDAEKDLAAWLSRGPRPTTQEVIDAICAQGVEGATLLDVGAGVGAVHTALLEAGAATAVDVDASREYLAVARAEAERRGLSDRVAYRYGDLVELVADVPPTDIVTLDSVICCYPYLPALVVAVVTVRPPLGGPHLSPRCVVDAGVHAALRSRSCVASQPRPLLRASPQPVAQPHGRRRLRGDIRRRFSRVAGRALPARVTPATSGFPSGSLPTSSAGSGTSST